MGELAAGTRIGGVTSDGLGRSVGARRCEIGKEEARCASQGRMGGPSSSGGGVAYVFDRVQRHSCHLGYKFIVLFRHLRYELIVIFHCGHLPVILALVNLKAVKTVRGVVALGTGKFASSPAH